MRLAFTLIWIAIVLLAFAAMWWGWRARARRDAGVLGASAAPVGELVARFGSAGEVQYVSTTPAGEPLTRVAAPGLRYRGPAEIAVHLDGATVEVAGERPVHLAAAQLLGGGVASRRVGKAVEAGGLALLRWRSGDRELESSFRFASREEQERFVRAIDEISGGVSAPQGVEAPSPQTEENQEGTR